MHFKGLIITNIKKIYSIYIEEIQDVTVKLVLGNKKMTGLKLHILNMHSFSFIYLCFDFLSIPFDRPDLFHSQAPS